MPNRPIHVFAGILAGGGFSVFQARDEEPGQVVCELVGGVVGGYVGGRMPDIIDPPTSPRHRSWGHGIIPVVVVGVTYAFYLVRWQEFLRKEAEKFRAWREKTKSRLKRLGHSFAEFILRAISGFLAGFFAGYVSHVLLDATTPGGLPWFG